ncbi:unnamed protein product [Rhodiola kirilowii]
MASRVVVVVTSLSLSAISGSVFSTDNPTDRRILVLLDDFAIKSSHSMYYESLQARWFELDFKLADDPKIALERFGEYFYDGLVILAPTIELKLLLLWRLFFE